MSCNVLSTVIGFFSGAIVGAVAAFVAHLFATNREAKNREHTDKIAKEARKRTSLAFWTGLERKQRGASLGNSLRFSRRDFTDSGRRLRRIRGDVDLGNQETFAELITALCQLTDSDVEEVADHDNYRGRTRVTEAIDVV
jgi:Flp pilus assembly protein TadB